MAEYLGFDQTIEALAKKAFDSWGGETGKRREKEIRAFLDRKLADYSKAFELSKEELLKTWERDRDYSAINYYQEANFPDPSELFVFKDDNEVKAVTAAGFRCPRCKGVSNNPTTCDTGQEMSPGKICDWKAYGFFKIDLFYSVVKSRFLTDGLQVYETFVPIELEGWYQIQKEREKHGH